MRAFKHKFDCKKIYYIEYIEYKPEILHFASDGRLLAAFPQQKIISILFLDALLFLDREGN